MNAAVAVPEVAPVATTAVGRDEPVREIERVDDLAVLVRHDVAVPLPGPPLIVVDVDVHGLAGVPVRAAERHELAGCVVALVT